MHPLYKSSIWLGFISFSSISIWDYDVVPVLIDVVGRWYILKFRFNSNAHYFCVFHQQCIIYEWPQRRLINSSYCGDTITHWWNLARAISTAELGYPPFIKIEGSDGASFRNLMSPLDRNFHCTDYFQLCFCVIPVPSQLRATRGTFLVEIISMKYIKKNHLKFVVISLN